MPPFATRDTVAAIDFRIEEFDQWRNPAGDRWLDPTRNTWCRLQDAEPETTE